MSVTNQLIAFVYSAGNKTTSLFSACKKMATAKKLDDVTECSICTEVYTDPRVLPCGHVFCFKCIEAWSNEKRQQRHLACPLCRTEFSLPLPSIEIDERKRNFIAVKFSQLEMKLKGLTVFIPPYGIMGVCLFVCLYGYGFLSGGQR